MNIRKILINLGMASLLIAGLGACTVAPAHRYAAQPATVYVDAYPNGYYGRSYDNRRHYEHREPQREYRREHYREPEPRYSEPRREATVRAPSPLEVHRDVRRSLGLPRLPGMP